MLPAIPYLSKFEMVCFIMQYNILTVRGGVLMPRIERVDYSYLHLFKYYVNVTIRAGTEENTERVQASSG